MNLTGNAGRKRSGESDFSYGPSKKSAGLDEGDEDGIEEGGSVSKTEEVKTLKQATSKNNFAKNYMSKHGYKEGSGLGKYGDGIVNPVEASRQKGTRGLGFEPADVYAAVSKFDPSLEEVSIDEEVHWLSNDYDEALSKEFLTSGLKIGYSKKCVDENSQFCDSHIIRNILTSKNVLNTITVKNLENGRGRSNPFETIRNAIFLNRAAMKMANLDAILDYMFTEPKDINGKRVVQPDELLYFADVCAGPGGFSEYIFYRKEWRAKGFGFTLRKDKDFMLEQFWAGPSESFEPHYGAQGDGNVYRPDNIISFKDHVLKHTQRKGVHFMMADGGVHIDEKFNDQELICKKLYLCQCLIALHIVRIGGHFVVKLFDIFTEFSVGLVYLMYRSFKEISIIKPNTSRPANSERYLVCKWKREDSKDIADHLFEINKLVPEYNEKEDSSKEDVLELIPSDILMKDKEFYNYILNSNNRFGNRQYVSLLKLISYSENVDLQDERQQEFRKACLKKWNIPDEARAEPKKSDARTKWLDLCGTSPYNFETEIRTLCSPDDLKKNIFSKYDWHCLVLSGEEKNNTCAFYLGLGRNNVHKFTSGKWVKLSDSLLCLPANTLVYGEIVNEYFGYGRGQRKISAFHIIDGLFLGKENIKRLSFKERLNRCELFAKALHKETCPVRVRTLYSMGNINDLKESLVLNSTKSSSVESLSIPLEADSFFKASGIIFIRDTRDDWNRCLSKTTGDLYLYNKKDTTKSVYEKAIEKQNMSEEVYADFEYSFHNRQIWWWDEKIIHNKQPDPSKLQWQDFLNL